MSSAVLTLLALVVTANAECQPGDAICKDQELPSNSLLQRDKRALGKELLEDSRAGVGAETVQEARVRIAKELNSNNFTISLGGCDPIRGAGDKSCCFSRGITCTNPPNPFKAAQTGCPLGALCTAPLNVNPFGAPSYGYCQCQGGSPCEGGQSCGMPSFPFGQSEEKPEEAAHQKMAAVESSAKEQLAETAQEARVRIAKELNSDNFTISLGGCDPIRGTGEAARNVFADKSCCFSRGITCTNPPNPFKAAETGCPLGALCTASLNVNPFAPPSYGYCQCQGGSPCEGGQSCGMPSFPFGESKDEPKEASQKDLGAIESSAKVTEAAKVGLETAQEARVRIAKELNSDNFTISLGQCDPIRGGGDKSCCFERGVTCAGFLPPTGNKRFEPAYWAMELARFKLLIRERFRDNASEVFRFLDDNRSGRVNRVTFAARLQTLHYAGKSNKLFDYLDRQGLGVLTVHSLTFLDRWSLPPYMYYQPDTKGMRTVKEKLIDMHMHPLIAWRKIDKDGSMRISYDEFRFYLYDMLSANKAMCVATSSFPKTEPDIAAVWRAMDKECTGYIELRDWDIKSHEHLAEFKTWADRTHGSATAAFRALDTGASGQTSNCKLSRKELERCTKGEDSCKAEIEFLFDGLDVNQIDYLYEADVKFLDGWDLAWEEWQAEAEKKWSEQG